MWGRTKNGAVVGNAKLGMDVMDLLTRGTIATRDGKEIRIQDVAAEVYDASRNANIFMKVSTVVVGLIGIGVTIYFIKRS